MVKFYEATMSVPYYTALPKDVVTNTFHFRWANTSDPTTADYDALQAALKAFYETIFSNASGITMAQFMRPALTRYKLYDMETPKPRVPLRNVIVPLTVGQDTNPGIFPEVAICASYQAAILSGDIAARKRGRLYIGGLGNSAEGLGSASTFPTPTATAITRINLAMKNLALLSSTYDWFWSVYSPTTNVATGSLVASFATVTNGWVDNAFDTQRRRGNAPSIRTVWP